MGRWVQPKSFGVAFRASFFYMYLCSYFCTAVLFTSLSPPGPAPPPPPLASMAAVSWQLAARYNSARGSNRLLVYFVFFVMSYLGSKPVISIQRHQQSTRVFIPVLHPREIQILRSQIETDNQSQMNRGKQSKCQRPGGTNNTKKKTCQRSNY